MDFTLDSKELASAILNEKFKGKKGKFYSKPVQIVGLEKLRNADSKTFYFGKLTFADVAANNEIMYDGQKILDVENSSEIIQLFQNIVPKDGAGATISENTALNGAFFGYELTSEY